MKKIILILFLIPSLSFGAWQPISVPAGGSGWGNFTAGTLLTGNGTSRLATTTIGSGLTLSGGVLSVSSGGAYSTTSANYWLTTKTTDNLTEGSNLYYTDARARLALSSSALGLTYTSATGDFSLTSGYEIASSTRLVEHDTAYSWGNHALGGYFLASNFASSLLADYNAEFGNLTATGTISLPANSITNAMVSDTLTASDLVAVSSVVSDAEVDNDITASNYLLLTGGNLTGSLGIGTTSPSRLLSVQGSALFSGNLTLANLIATGTISIGSTTPYARLAIKANAGSAVPLVQVASSSDDIYFEISSTGTTTIEQLQTGVMTFETDAGVVTWMDMPVTSATAIGTPMSYSAMTDASSTLTIYAESDGSGGIRNQRVGIATTTPGFTLSVEGNVGLSGNLSLANLITTGTITGNLTGDVTGNADTATALASNPTDCSANQFANAIDTEADLTCSALIDADVPDTLTASNYLPLSGGTVAGTLGVTGLSTLTGGFISSASSSVAAQLNVSGPLSASSTLSVVGASNLATTTLTAGLILANSGGTQGATTTDGAVWYDRTNEDLTIGDGSASQIVHTGVWKTWTPTIAGVTAGTTYVARYTQVGKTINGFIGIYPDATHDVTGVVTVTLPVPPKAPSANLHFGIGTIYAENAGISGYSGYIRIIYPSTNPKIDFVLHSGAVPLVSQLSASYPFDWGSGDYFHGTFTYEAK